MPVSALTHLAVLLLAWTVADLATAVLIRLSRRLRWLDHPHGHKTHREPTPLLGGVGIYLAVGVSLAVVLVPVEGGPLLPILGIFLGGTLVMALGALDDFRPINAVVKLGVLAVATLVISSFGVYVSIFPGGAANPLNLLVTLFWIVGVTSATNSLDHSNGAAAGSLALACGTIALIAWGNSVETSQAWLGYLSLAIAGGCLGFLRHNLAGGRVFLGNNGSFLLGFLTASTLVFARWSEDPFKALFLPVVVLTVPLYDLTLTTALRIKNGVVRSVREAIVYCGKDHLAHRLWSLGLGPRVTLLLIYALGVVSGAIAIVIQRWGSRSACLTALGAYLIFLGLLGVVLDRAPVRSRRGWPAPPRLPGTRSLKRSKGRPAATSIPVPCERGPDPKGLPPSPRQSPRHRVPLP